MWDWSYTLFVLPDILKALKITIMATFLGFAMACILGLILAICRRSPNKILSMTVGAFVEFTRTTPLLAQLYFIFYVFPLFGLVLSPLAAGVIGLGLHYSTYLSEVYRAGIDSIPQAQWEAATALSFSKKQVWLKIILPQAIPPILPVMGNYLIGMFKDTPLLSAITLLEILQVAKLFGSQYFRYLEPITIVGLLFLVLSYISSLGIKRLEAKLNH
ncbi:MAG: ectoine/hydroxyectoine ABC transporter permease subunit EhuD [Syntrophomonadales bacterium]|jgi:polar amino acid transport system permease protein